MTTQLPLAWPAPAHFRFDQFDTTGNEDLPALLSAFVQSAGDAVPLLLVGASGAGKTHLLVAAATLARENGQAATYLALSRWSDFDADALDALASSEVVVIDEIDSITGSREAEIALFDLYNRCRDRGVRLLLASREPPARLALALPDLRSRLSAANLLSLAPLGESARRELLRRRALARGFELDESVIDFLFRRYRRDLPALMELIERLDRESLARQRRVTLPLVRAVIDSAPAAGNQGTQRS
jgi:DnaA family protein